MENRQNTDQNKATPSNHSKAQNAALKTSQLSSQDLEQFQKRLEEHAMELESSIQGLDEQSKMDTPQGSGDLNTLRTHPADQGTQLQDQERNRQVANLETRELEAVQFALRRIQEGGFGICAECGEQIPRVRLNAIPWAALDVKCQEELEAESSPAVTKQI